MLVGHVPPSYPVYHFIYSFHMPLFFVLAGVFAKDYQGGGRNEFVNLLKKDAKRLVLPVVIRQANEQSGLRVVVLVDEYDKPMLDVIGTRLEEVNREVLRGFYSVFKLVDAHLRFVLLTGVTKFSQVSVFSGINQPYDISMSADYDSLCGITEQELHTALKDSVSILATKLNCSIDEAYWMLKLRYDGYHFSPMKTDVYNPISLFNAFSEGVLRDYWFRTGTPMYLIRLLEGSSINMEQLLNGVYSDDYFVDYRANTEEPLAMLY